MAWGPKPRDRLCTTGKCGGYSTNVSTLGIQSYRHRFMPLETAMQRMFSVILDGRVMMSFALSYKDLGGKPLNKHSQNIQKGSPRRGQGWSVTRSRSTRPPDAPPIAPPPIVYWRQWVGPRRCRVKLGRLVDVGQWHPIMKKQWEMVQRDT